MAFFVLLSLVGCNVEENKGAKEYDLSSPLNRLISGVVADNGRYELIYDAQKYVVVLSDKQTLKKWTSMPQQYYDSNDGGGRQKILMESPLYVDYYDSESNTTTRVFAYNGPVKDGRISSEKIENGVRLYYYFDQQEFVIPVDYTLNSDGISITVVPSLIEEHKYSLFSVSIAPFMCSASNETENAYLLVPSGSGALMYTNVRGEEKSRVFTGEVYGKDYAREYKTALDNELPIKLPVFAAVDGQNAIMGIVESGAEQAKIEAEAGNADIGYSSVYTSFYIRGFDEQQIQTTKSQTYLLTKLAEGISKDAKYTVRYIPLEEEQASYSGVAARYREYLLGKETADIDDYRLNVTILGGTMVDKSFVGINYSGFETLTTFEEASKILEDMSGFADKKTISCILKGFTENGIDIGKPAGNFTIAKDIGSKKNIETLNGKGVKLFYDYDLVRFSQSGSSISKNKDAATSVTSLRAYQYPITFNLQCWDEKSPVYYLVSRNNLSELVDKLIDKKPDGAGVSLETLSNMAYSDYNEDKYFARGNMGSDVSSYFKRIKESGSEIAASSANDYAAKNADLLVDAPLQSSKSDAFDVDVPFYQMVFSGHKNMACEYINTSDNPRKSFLKTLESGCALNFMLAYRYDENLIYKSNYPFYALTYSSNYNNIKAYIKEADEFYKAISSSKIISNDVVNEDLRVTVFDNGVKLFVNYGEAAYETEFGEIEPLSFVFGTEVLE
jgi:hypothetical protein